MRKINIWESKSVLVVIFTLLLFSTKAFSQQTILDSYTLGSDDVINVTIFDEPDLSLQEVRISSAGTIAMPLIGQVELKGLTATHAEKKITERYLDGYLKKPDVTITIIEYRQFYVNGEVDKPGGYSYRDGMTVQRAITLAGGFTERASTSKIYLLREQSKDGRVLVDLNYSVKPGDVITIEESFF